MIWRTAYRRLRVRERVMQSLGDEHLDVMGIACLWRPVSCGDGEVRVGRKDRYMYHRPKGRRIGEGRCAGHTAR